MEIRAFFALTLPAKVVRSLADHADTLCEFDRQIEVEWVDSDTYHLTLSFLGDISLEQVDKLESLTKKRLEDFRSFQVSVDDTAYYRVSKSLAIIAAMPQPNPDLVALHETMVAIADEAGIAHQDKGFKAHITLGRIAGKDNQFEAPAIWPNLDLMSLADSVVLFQSKPGKRGSIYTPLFSVSLPDMA
ncbi:MAG: RNA 2',3'-cyclic phosphodiesterase [Pontibacterium sp.]